MVISRNRNLSCCEWLNKCDVYRWVIVAIWIYILKKFPSRCKLVTVPRKDDFVFTIKLQTELEGEGRLRWITFVLLLLLCSGTDFFLHFSLSLPISVIDIDIYFRVLWNFMCRNWTLIMTIMACFNYITIRTVCIVYYKICAKFLFYCQYQYVLYTHMR